jgi:hypothetical protein
MSNEKLRHSLHRTFEKFSSKTFDEYDIKLFLIEIRAFLREETFLREVADFVAHPERNKGICHKAIDSRYARMKMNALGVDNLSKKNIFKSNPGKPWRFFSDQILDYINVRKISKIDYQLFVINSLEDINEELIIKYYKLAKEQIRALLEITFRLENGFYVINPEVSEGDIFAMADLLKFLRGTITTQGVVTQENLHTDFIAAISKLNKLHGFSLVIEDLEKSLNEITICILALLHDSSFIMYDGTQAKSFLSIHGQELQITEASHRFKFFTLTLMVDTGQLTFPVVTTNIRFEEYIDDLDDPESMNLQRIPWVYTERTAASLKLVIGPDEYAK